MNYIHDKYGIDSDILNNETHRVGFNRYQRVSFSLPNSDTDHWYDVCVSYDESDKKTPIVVSDTYMNEYLRPLLTDYLNALIGTKIAKTVNVYSREDVPDGFAADFPVISNVDGAESLIVTQELFLSTGYMLRIMRKKWRKTSEIILIDLKMIMLLFI